ncbi:galactose-binding domain-like protein, partial [Lactarius pseudohatsudake]
RVSSTLDKSLGKSYLVDGSPETCWTSQQGLPQFIQLTFPSPVVPKRLSLTFQGGFVGTTCLVATQSQGTATWEQATYIYPEDANRAQTFDLLIMEPVGGIKLIFEESSDFFGRVTVYDLMVEGQL